MYYGKCIFLAYGRLRKKFRYSLETDWAITLLTLFDQLSFPSHIPIWVNAGSTLLSYQAIFSTSAHGPPLPLTYHIRNLPYRCVINQSHLQDTPSTPCDYPSLYWSIVIFDPPSNLSIPLCFTKILVFHFLSSVPFYILCICITQTLCLYVVFILKS